MKILQNFLFRRKKIDKKFHFGIKTRKNVFQGFKVWKTLKLETEIEISSTTTAAAAMAAAVAATAALAVVAARQQWQLR